MQSVEIVKPQVDKRSYSYFKLDNGIRCFLIHDPEGDMSAASLDVKVGAALDPKDSPGTAHFLEHMLFQGTEKYPSENEYSEFMSNNGGMNNAFTSQTNTNFHFECSNEAFEEGFDRMAQFFISPKFSKDSAEREVNAVDSEYNMSLQVDQWHQHNLHQALSNKDSLYNKFMCGNKESLDKEGIRDILLEYHKKWYSSNIMCVTLSSKNSIEDMTKWVTEKLSPVKNFNVTVPNLMEPAPFTAETQAKLIKLVPIKDIDELNFMWTLPYCETDYKRNPLSYFSHLFGHEGENSILSWLKNEGLALELCAGGDHNLWGFSMFEITIKLTKKGLENYEKVIEAVYQYAKVINDKGPQEYVFNESKNIGQMSFEFSDKGGTMNTCVSMSRRIQIMAEDDMPQILRSRYVSDVYDPEQLAKYSKLLTQTDNLLIFLKSKSFKEDESIKLEQEKWYKTMHVVQPFSEDLLKKMNNPNCDISRMKLDLPPANTLIPENLKVLPEDKDHGKTALLKKWDDTDLWYQKDNKFDRPKAYVYMKIYTADDGFGTSAEKRVFAQVWQQVIDEYLREFSYMADCAKMGFGLNVLHDNLSFSFNGFNDKMPTYIVEIMKRILAMKDSDQKNTFDNIKEKLLLDWKNFYLDQTFRQIMPTFRVLMYKNAWEHRELRKVLEDFTYEKFMEQVNTWLKGGQYVFYVYGNYESDGAIKLVEQVRDLLKLEATNMKKLPHVNTLQLQEGQSVTIWDELDDKTNDNSCVVSYYQLGPCDYRKDLCLQIIAQSFEEPFFDDLRTKQQLGYVVASRYSDERGCLGLWFLVQSAQKSCEYLVSCINKFLMDRREFVSKMTEEEFKVQKNSVRTQVAEKDKNMAEESSRHWGEISGHTYDFDKQEKELEILDEISLDQFKWLFEHLFFSKKSKRLDLELTSVKHKYNQAEYLAKNQVDPYFSQFLNRTIFPGNLTDFKNQATFMSDDIKIRFMQQREVYVDSRPVLGYWKIRGLGSNIRYQLEYCGVDYDSKFYYGYQDWFMTDKKNLGLEFPNIPYLIHGDTKMTESCAIHQYIAEVWDQTLLGKTAQDKAKVNMLMSLLNEFRWKIIRLCYDQNDKAKPIELYKTFLPQIVDYIGKNDFLIGDYPTYIDFYFFETLQLLAMISDKAVFTEFKVFGDYHDRFLKLKGVSDYVNDPFCPELFMFLNAYNNISKINGKLTYDK